MKVVGSSVVVLVIFSALDISLVGVLEVFSFIFRTRSRVVVDGSEGVDV